MKRSTEFLKSLDVKLILILCALCVTSIAAIYSSQQTGQYGAENFALKQGINYIIGIVMLLLVASVDSDQLQKLSWPLYIATFLSIILLKILPVSTFTPEILGAKRWFRFPLIGSIQPSEFFKIALVMLVANLAVKHNAQHMVRTFKTDLILVGKIMLVSIPPTAIVYSQPDTGMVFLYAAAIACILFMSGIQKKLIAICTVIPVTILSVLMFIYFKYQDFFYNNLVTLLKPHQQSRILGWLDPFEHTDQGYQTQQSILAVGSGGMEGKGFGGGSVYIPEKHTDFIFATIAEEGGFIVAALVVFLFLLLLYRTIIIGYSADNLFGTLLCAGSIGILTVQIFQNIGMIVGLMPVKGIALPFLSYGGSSLFSNMIMMGLILSVRKTYKKYMFSVK
ncbi:FtsW/RodA/SpoVE family cell cycle protein [Bacillus sp. S70]|uniref:FtsW/RodA/SpoVE family cell cycle protein n=1 Tax=unclassified Bacillus (in: firmicutes) TaxID=185979 RepID=UPI0019093E2C|nr:MULTISPECIES: FtsW/RodA/SpoVE family cell cycle protein [unclassified Bacillus (in: firmicutes)]MDA1664247.1 FtsW/RodA/SpoVE family cell cycle protein [Bacillus cereus]MBJ9979676.1 FtsW/RodA/SpoVE family cell cycle protein [Bacillus sp. S29]MBK0100854.1 FtsW/RodA/SpoVE family cell cycle protein [Bacillus sp. S70]MBK0105472.1 FtsW/RodA/SpoVE family cell cycle protein [Bacillus sp. S73]MBK0134303.1 FtsW/RodA/SpoVE family cell cycle protein [Bacillus sp. S72]